MTSIREAEPTLTAAGVRLTTLVEFDLAIPFQSLRDAVMMLRAGRCPWVDVGDDRNVCGANRRVLYSPNGKFADETFTARRGQNL